MRIALVAHDCCKDALIAWSTRHRAVLAQQTLYATGTTGKRIALETKLKVTRLLSGPLGGDQQLGAMIAEGRIDALVFFSIRFQRYPTMWTSKPCCGSQRCIRQLSQPTVQPQIYLSRLSNAISI
ncbi:methylglyoxal synthase [Sulfitobacter sp. SBS6]|jgi:methylglyoxal synthase|uniref:methylglyoxal synthase n=1 Tax=Sulfitobacter sp. SBS6 TaxID=3401755 RepID=UPI003AAFCE1A